MGRMLPLAFLPEGATAVVRQVVGGRGLVRRLTELGFTPNTPVVLYSSFGPLVVLVRGTRVVLGRGEAMKIIVEELP